ncbi:MAG: Uma2 family endonuclease [Chloroflexi bacterium]|nr:Uma2 family endonuclease [Chloroflexota bacterium]
MVEHIASATIDDLWALPSDVHAELIRGEIVEMAPTGTPHGNLSASIHLVIGPFIKANKLGKSYIAETGFILFDNPPTVRVPDVAFVRQDRLNLDTGTFFPGPPDLAVEVVSPSDRADDINGKINQYLEAGTLEVWVVYPSDRSMMIFTPDETRRLTGADQLDRSAALPGLSVQVSALLDYYGEEQ